MTKKAVLIVEDSTPFRTLMGSMLSKDFDVITARNGLEAMSWLQSGLLPDVIVTDVHMPEIDGNDLISNLRCSGVFQKIPVLVVSGSSEMKQLADLRKLGAQDVLTKPFQPIQLTSTIKRLAAQEETVFA
jgi:CheY-like chemotaxis protein